MSGSIEKQARFYAIKMLSVYLVTMLIGITVLIGIFTYIDAKLLLIATTTMFIGFICAGIYLDYYNEKLEELKNDYKYLHTKSQVH